MQKPPDCLWRAQLWRADHHQRLYQIVLALCFESLYKRFRHESAVGMSDDTHLPRLRVCRERFDFRNKVYNTALCRNAIFKNLFGRKAPIVGKGAPRRNLSLAHQTIHKRTKPLVYRRTVKCICDAVDNDARLLGHTTCAEHEFLQISINIEKCRRPQCVLSKPQDAPLETGQEKHTRAARRDSWGVIDVLEEDRARKERVHEHIGVVGKYVAHVLVGKGKDDLLAGLGA